MKKLVFVLAAVAIVVVMASCHSKQKDNQIEMIAEAGEDSIYMINDSTLGEMQTYVYEGVIPATDGEGVRYFLTIESEEIDGDGMYMLTTTYIGADNGRDKSFTHKGKKETKRGIPGDNNAVVCMLIPDDSTQETVYFITEGDSALTMVDKNYKTPSSKADYTIKRVK